MTEDMKLELWRAVVSSLLLILVAGVAVAVSFLNRIKTDQDRRAALNEHRDAQRDEVQENVRRISNGLGIRTEEPHTPPTQRAGAVDHREMSEHFAAYQARDRENRRRVAMGMEPLPITDENKGGECPNT